MIQVKVNKSTTLSQLLDGDSMNHHKNNIGLLETLGENIGEKWDT